MRPADIQRLFELPAAPHPGPIGAVPVGNADLTAAEKAQRIASLQQVLLSVQQYWIAGSPSMDLAAEILGDGSRDGKQACPSLPVWAGGTLPSTCIGERKSST